MKKFFPLILSLILILGIVGCDNKGPQSLEEYYDISEHRTTLITQLNNENTEYESVYLKIDFDVKDNLLIYKYTFATPVQTNSISKSIEMRLTEEFIHQKISDIENTTGIKGVSIQYIYYKPDNTEVFNRIYTSD